MPKVIDPANQTKRARPARKTNLRPDTIRREYAGKFVAWTPDGRKIVAVASSAGAAEKKAALAGYPMVAVAKVPKGRTAN